MKAKYTFYHLKKIVSSGNIIESIKPEEYFKLVTNNKNNKGPKMVPWSTPHVTDSNSVFSVLLIWIYWFLLLKQLPNYLGLSAVIPWNYNFIKGLRNHNRKLFLCPSKKTRKIIQHFKLLFFKLNLHFDTSN